MTKPSIYDQHDKAFAQVSAYVILKNGERVATIAFKFPRDGAGRLWAYVHWLGTPMVRGKADGFGYDKRSAAAAAAAGNLDGSTDLSSVSFRPDGAAERQAFRSALIKGCDLGTWDRELEKAGFTVLQAV